MGRSYFWVFLLISALLAGCGQGNGHKRPHSSGPFTIGEAGQRVPAPHFELMAQTGEPFSSNSLKGKVYVLNFFFTSCPDICPKMNRQMAAIQDTFLHDLEFRQISITIDPEFDSLPRLRKYAVEMGAKPGRWYFLRGTRDQVSSLSSDGFFLPLRAEGMDRSAFIHSSRLVLVDKKGLIYGYYDALVPDDINRLKADIRKLLSN